MAGPLEGVKGGGVSMELQRNPCVPAQKSPSLR